MGEGSSSRATSKLTEHLQIPGHHAPPIIFASIVTYLIAFKKSLERTPFYQVVAEEHDATVVNQDGDIVAEDVDLVEFDDKGNPVAETEQLIVDGDEASKLLAGRSENSDQPQTDPRQLEVVSGDMIILGERPPHILRSLLTGLPSPTSRFWNVVTVLMHLLPALMTADVVYRAPMLYPSHDLSFAKLGFVSDSTANILVREPDAARLPINLMIKPLSPITDLQTVTHVGTDRPWKEVGRVTVLADETDFTEAIRVTNLRSSWNYAWTTSTGHNGTFATAARPGHFQPDGGNKFTFLSTSCIKPRFPYNVLDHPLSIPGFKHLASALDTLKPAFMLFLGDWVYVDVPRRMGEDKESYRREHRQMYASPDWPAVSKIPWVHVIDDHEIQNDWDKNWTHPYPSAIDAYDLYHGSVNPPAPAEPHGATWRIFTQGPASFFLMDTRQYRVDDFMVDGPGKTMLGDLQLHALLRWLEAPEPSGVHWKVVVSSVPFTVNWRINSQDTWAGFKHERRILLEKMWDVGASPSGMGVVVLSGDRHEFAATSFPPPQGGKWPVSATVHEFSCSPLSMFYLPIRTYWEENDKAIKDGREEDVCIKYVPDGNSKFGAIEIEREVGGDQSRLHYRLFVDGKESWSYNIMSPPKGRGPRGKDAVWA